MIEMNLQKLTKKQLIDHINSLNTTITKLQSELRVSETSDIPNQVSQLGHILDNSLNEILIFDAETFKFVFTNQSARNNLGYSASEFYDMTPLDINPELTPESAEKLVEPLLNDEQSRLNFETALKRKDGSIYPVYVVLQLSTFNGQKVFVANKIDITEQKKAIQNVTQLGNILDNSLNEILIFDSETFKFVFVNDSARSNLGYTSEEFYNMTPLDINPELTPESAEQLVQPLLSGEESRLSFETALKRKDGSIYPVYVLLQLSKYNNRKVFVANKIDITEQKKALDELQKSERKYKALYEDNPSMYFTVSEKGIVISVNKFGAEQLLGYRPDELIGKPVLNVFYEEDKEAVNEQFSLCLNKPGKIVNWEFRKVKKDGTVIWVKESARVVEKSSGQTVVLIVCDDITEYKKLVEQATQLGEILDSSLNEIYIFDPGTLNLIFVNEGARKNLGYTLDELTSMNALDIKPNITVEDITALVNPLVNGKTDILVFETEYQRKNGTLYPVEVYLQISQFNGQDVFLANIIDVTERKKAQEDLRISEERYRVLHDQSPIGICVIDKDLRIIQTNHKMVEMFESTHYKVIGLDLNKLKDKSFVPIISEAFDGKSGKTDALYSATTSSAFKWLSVSSAPIRDTEGKVLYVICVVEDISEMKKAQEALEASEQQLRLIADGLPVFISYVSKDLHYEYVNKYHETWFNTDIKDIIGRHIKDLHGNKTFSLLESYFRKVLSGYEEEVEHSVLHPEMGERFISAKLIPHKSQEGILGFYVLATDITDRKKHEEELLHTQKMDSIGLLAGGLAHDFNNYLTSILGNIALAKLDVPDENPAYIRLENTEKACIRAKNITQQLLTFSKGGEPVKEPLDLAELITETAEFSARGSTSKCKFDIQPDLWKIEADKGQIAQVINNLVINSIQSMPNGGLITISAMNIADSTNEDHILLEILDTGIGIEDNHLNKVFDPYFTTKQSGSGLGLTTVYSIIKKHGGTIDIRSLVGRGTKISITLPAINSMSDKATSKRINGISKYSGRVLVMDDDDEVRDALCNILRKLGFEIDHAKDGAQTIQKYEKALNNGTIYDLVILDLTVSGGMGGKETILRLKEIDPNINALICSGYSNDPVMSEFENFGFKGVIKKPYTIDDLKATLDSALLK